MSSHPRLLAAAVMLAAIATSPLARAETRNLAFMANGSGICTAALPAFEGLIRKRPAALQNEGTASAFVTCSPVALQNVAAGFGSGMYLINYGEASATVTCTAVTSATGTANWTSTKSVAVPPNGGGNTLYWNASDGLTASNSLPTSTSCNLPPGVGITSFFFNQVLDVGA